MSVFHVLTSCLLQCLDSMDIIMQFQCLLFVKLFLVKTMEM